MVINKDLFELKHWVTIRILTTFFFHYSNIHFQFSKVFIKSGLLSSFSRLKVLDLSENPITCDLYVAKFYELATKNTSLTVVNWKNGSGYVCHMEDALEKTLTFKVSFFYLLDQIRDSIFLITQEYYDSHAWEPKKHNGWYSWISGFILGSIIMVFVAAVISVNLYRNRFFIQYSLLIKRNILEKRRNPELDYTYDVFVSYSQVGNASDTSFILRQSWIRSSSFAGRPQLGRRPTSSNSGVQRAKASLLRPRARLQCRSHRHREHRQLHRQKQEVRTGLDARLYS